MTAGELSERLLDVGGRPVRVLERGSGETATVLLHGGLQGHSPWIGAADLWAPLMRAADGDGRIVAIDLPGCGGSPLGDRQELTIAGIAARVADTLRALGVAEAVPVGHAEASLAALLLARRQHADLRVPGAVVVAATGAAPTSDGVSPVVLENPPAPLGSTASVRWALDRLSYSAAHVTDGLVAALAGHAAGDAQRAASETAARADVALELESDLLGEKLALFAYCRDVGYEVPVTVVWGSHDPLVTVAHGDGLFELLATTRAQLDFALLNRVGHFPFSEDPAAMRRLVEPFVARCTAKETTR
ncbi:alpha/beta fold hydrolase [Conexibacter sp. CPCC 206217]|uniref:alpha/beta fold hydrolase n=1 Tax=Conexibacter sp. CPCC 206217 TaxID=3064574 RepID=UPI002718F5AC|nr:alpha/beta hydrolase [Conexibacter sp. CPCC 206217]MDO8212062.1 alpha/beta hydrolase [Conexibacter sp. CPCC 206217]